MPFPRNGRLGVAVGAIGFALMLGHSLGWPQGKKEKSVEGKSGKNDEIVNAFIAYDIGQLQGQAGREAYKQFQSLQGDAALPAVTRGVNKAACINSSCPIIVLAGKFNTMLTATTDPNVVKEAMESLKSECKNAVYGNYVENLRLQAAERFESLGGKSALKRKLRIGTPSQLRRSKTPLADWSLEDVHEAIADSQDADLIPVLEEVVRRQGSEYSELLAKAIAKMNEGTRPLARGLLAQRFTRMTDRTIIAKLSNKDAEIRGAAALAAGYKGSPLCVELARLVRDSEVHVAEAARNSLVKLIGEDLGPPDKSAKAEWFSASRRWEQRATEELEKRAGK